MTGDTHCSIAEHRLIMTSQSLMYILSGKLFTSLSQFRCLRLLICRSPWWASSCRALQRAPYSPETISCTWGKKRIWSRHNAKNLIPILLLMLFAICCLRADTRKRTGQTQWRNQKKWGDRLKRHTNPIWWMFRVLQPIYQYFLTVLEHVYDNRHSISFPWCLMPST